MRKIFALIFLIVLCQICHAMEYTPSLTTIAEYQLLGDVNQIRGTLILDYPIRSRNTLVRVATPSTYFDDFIENKISIEAFTYLRGIILNTGIDIPKITLLGKDRFQLSNSIMNMKGYPNKDFQIGIVLPKTYGMLDISAAFSYLIRWKYKYYNPRDCYSANLLADLILSEAFSVEGILGYSAMKGAKYSNITTMNIKGNFETGRILASVGLKKLWGLKESLYTLDKLHEGIEALISLRLNDIANLGICAEKTANLDNIGGTMEFQFGRFSLDISGKYGSYNHSEIIYNTSLAIKVSL